MRIRVPCSTANLGSGIDCLGVALNRYLTVCANVAAHTSFAFGEGFPVPIANEDNLFLDAVRQTCACVGRPVPHVRAHMTTEIPTSRGLGSSATAIAAGVLFANETLGRPLSQSELVTLAARIEGHPDNVAPCLLGGFVAASMHDGQAFTVRRPVASELAFVAAIPDFCLSTHAAREALPDSIPLPIAVSQLQRACLLTAALADERWELLQDAMQDDVFTPARKHLIPGFDDVYQAARDAGAIGVMLSGAGPTVVALALDHRKEIASAMQAAFAQHHIPAEAAILFADNAGATITAE